MFFEFFNVLNVLTRFFKVFLGKVMESLKCFKELFKAFLRRGGRREEVSKALKSYFVFLKSVVFFWLFIFHF